MTLPKAKRTHPAAAELLLDDVRPDYADAFEIAVPDGDSRTAEQAFRDALGATPGALGSLVLWAHRQILRFRLGPFAAPDYAIGWKILHAEHDVLVLQADGPLMRGILILRRTDRTAVLMTYLLFHRHRTARAVWSVVGHVHRAVAPRLMERSARHSFTPPSGRSQRTDGLA
jgi:hypothetical protein